jgi:hypothetical protein
VELTPRTDRQFLKDLREVVLHSPRAQVELYPDFGIGQALKSQTGDVFLSGSEITALTIMGFTSFPADGSTFDLSSGALLAGPAVSALEVFPVKCVHGNIQVRI